MDTLRIEFPLKSKQKLVETEAVKLMMKGLKKLIDFGAIKGDLDDILLNYSFEDRYGYAVAELKKDSLVDASKLNSIGASFQYPQDAKPEDIKLEDKQFSVQSIEIRMKELRWTPKIRFTQTIRDFRKYWKSKSSKLMKDPVQAKRLRNLFLLELSGIFAEVLPYIEEGKQLAALTGINVLTQGMTSSARDLSLAYRKALRASKTGQLSKNVYTGLRIQYNNFINQLIPQVFPGINEVISGADKESSRSFSDTTYGVVTITSDDIKPWEDLINSIRGQLESTKAPVIVTIGANEFRFDSMNAINSMESKQMTKMTTQFSNGRVRMFDDNGDYCGYVSMIKIEDSSAPYSLKYEFKPYKNLEEARETIIKDPNFKYKRVKDRIVKTKEEFDSLIESWRLECQDLNAKANSYGSN
jgi:vacuolar-type H+-ATPase subunit F/Vma7